MMPNADRMTTPIKNSIHSCPNMNRVRMVVCMGVNFISDIFLGMLGYSLIESMMFAFSESTT